MQFKNKMFIIIALTVILGMLLVIMHSYYDKGPFLTWNFFLFLFFLIFSKSAKPELNTIDLNISLAWKPLIFSFLGAGLVSIIFYSSWCIAESITEYNHSLRGKILTIVILAGVITLSTAYAVGFLPSDNFLAKFFVGYPFKTAWEWFYYSAHFLCAYLLINCSKYKYYDWKVFFLILPLVEVWLSRFFINPLPKIIENHIFIYSLIIFAVIKPLKSDYVRFQVTGKAGVAFVQGIPILVTAVIFLLTIFLNLATVGSTKLVYGIPLILFLLLTINKKTSVPILLSLITITIMTILIY